MTEENVIESKEDQIAVYIGEALPHIDRDLAAREIALSDRRFRAAVEYVRYCVTAVSEDGKETSHPGESSNFIATSWFAIIFFHVDNWYRDRYGVALDRKPDKHIKGVVEIAGTPFALHIPTIRRRPGKPGETIWIGIPDGVRDDESPIKWIEAGPNVEKLDEDDRGSAIAEASDTAEKLRYIRTSLMAVAHGDEKLVGLMSGILPRLENAASLLLQTKETSVQNAYWEIQLACEHAMKALKQQQSGAFRQTHDLFVLFDDTNPKPAFNREILKRMPQWRDTTSMRYGVGNYSGRRQGHKTYRDGLTVVAGTVRVLHNCGIGRAEFEIRRPPWFKFVDEAQQSDLR